MKTNEQAQKVIEFFNELTGDLMIAAKDGKVEVKEIVAMLLRLLPLILMIINMSDQDDKDAGN